MKPNDTDLVRFADDLLDPQRSERLLHAADHDAALRQTLDALEASRLPFKAAFDQRPVPAIPAKLRADLRDWASVIRDCSARSTSVRRSGWMSALAQAACVVLCVMLGYAIGAGRTAHHPSHLDVHTHWVQRVAAYQSLYVADTTRAIEPNVERAWQKMRKLADTVGIRTAIPDLRHAGYHFARMQELGFEGRPMVQLVYNKAGKPPLAICFMPAHQARDTRINLTRFAQLSLADWIDQNQHFALVATESADTLKLLYNSIKSEFNRV